MAFGLRDLAQVAITAEDKTQPAFDSLKRNVADVRGAFGNLQGMLAGLGVGLSTGAFAAVIKGAIDANGALNDLKDTTALTVQTLSGLQQSARIFGADFNQVTDTAQKFARSVAEAAGGNLEYLRSFEALGFSMQRLRDGKFDDLFTEFARKIANAENKTYGIAYAMQLAGRSAGGMLPFFKDIAEAGIEQARVTEDQARKADDLGDQFGRLGNEFDRFINDIAVDLVPAFSEITMAMHQAYLEGGGLLALWVGLGGAAANIIGVTERQKQQSRLNDLEKELSIAQKQLQSGTLNPAGASDSFFNFLIPDITLNPSARASLNAQVTALNAEREKILLAMTGGPKPPREVFKLPPPPAAGTGKADTAGPALIAQLSGQLAELNGESSVVEQTIRKLTDGTKKYTVEVQASALAIAMEIDELKDAKTAREAYVKAAEMDLEVQDDVQKVLVKISDAQAKANVTAYEAIERVKLETELIGMSNAERERRLALLDLEKSKQHLTPEEQARYRDGLNEAFDRKAAAEAHQKLVEDVKRQNEQITESLTDALLRGFESGYGFAQNFRETLKNMFNTLILRPLIQPIAQGAAGAIGGVLGGMGVPGYAGGSFGGGGGIFNAGIGQLLDPVLSGVGASVFGGAGAYASALGLSSSAAGSQAALLAAQTGEFGLAGLSATASSAGAGVASTALSALPYIGMAVAAYSLLKGGSKGGPAHFTGLDVSGTAGAGGLLDSQWWGNSANSKQGFRFAVNDHNASGGINQLIHGVYADMASLAEQLGLDPGRLSGATAGFSFRVTAAGNAGKGPTTQEVIDAFGQNLGQLTDQLALQLMPNLKAFAQANETATETLVRLVQVQEQLRQEQEQVKGQLVGIVRGLPGALGITGLENARNALKTSEFVSPLDRLSAVRGLLESTYQSALGGDLSAVGAFPQVLQQALSIGRDVGASGPAFQELFLQGNKQLNDLLARQQAVQQELLQNVPVAVFEAAQDTIGELRRQTTALVASNENIIYELRRIGGGLDNKQATGLRRSGA